MRQHQNLHGKPLKRLKKTTVLQSIENIHYELQKLNARFYLVQAYQSFPNHLTSNFHFQILTFFFWSTLGVHTNLNLNLFLNLHKKKMGFHPTQMNERRMFKELNPFFFSENPLEDWLEDL